MLIIGDVLAVAAAIFGVGLTTWATLLAIGLLFADKAERARQRLEYGAFRLGAIGAVIALTLGLLSLLMLGNPLPLVKLLGTVLLGWLLAVACVGASGVATLLAERIDRFGADMKPFTRLSRGTALLVGAGLLPLAGWFVFAPAMLLVSLGAGWYAVVGREAAAGVGV